MKALHLLCLAFAAHADEPAREGEDVSGGGTEWRRRRRAERKSRLTVVNGLEGDAAVDVFFAGREGTGLWSAGPPAALKEGTMICVAAGLQSGFEFEVVVGSVDDAFHVVKHDAAVERGATYAQAGALIKWQHIREGDATIYLTGDGDAHPVWAEDADEVASLAWKDGVGALFEDADRFLLAGDDGGASRAFATARTSLNLAVATDGAAPLVYPLAVLAGVAPVNATHLPRVERVVPLDGDAARPYVDRVTRRAATGCWLARLTLGSWRAHGLRGFAQDCTKSVDAWTALLRDIAPPGGGSPQKALVRTKHVNLVSAELLVDHWLLADGMATLRDDAQRHLEDEDDEDDAVVPEVNTDAPAPASSGMFAGFARRLFHGPDDVYDEVVFDGAPAEGPGGGIVDDAGAAYLERRALAGDGHAALALGDALLDGRVDNRVRRRFGNTAAAAAKMYAEGMKSSDEHASADAAAALAELWLGGHEGVPARLGKALEVLEASAETPLGEHLLGHLYDVVYLPERSLPNRSLAIQRWETAVEQGHADAFVSLARALRDTDATRAESLLSDALKDGDSLTAALSLAQMHRQGFLDGDWELETTNLEALRCSRALDVLGEGVQQAWDAATPGFGVSDAVAAGRAAWEVQPLSERFFAPSVPEEEAIIASGDAAADLLEALRSRVDARTERRRRNHASGLNAPARARGAYRMLATLGEAGLGAAHVNAGFVLERLARQDTTNAAQLLQSAKSHYVEALTGKETNDSRIARSARKLEFAEARRALAACRRDGWRGACDSCEEDPAAALLEAAQRGSEWAALEASLEAVQRGAFRRATVLASDCSYRFGWPHRVPCALVAAALSARAAALDFDWFFQRWGRRDRARHVDAPVGALLAEFG